MTTTFRCDLPSMPLSAPSVAFAVNSINYKNSRSANSYLTRVDAVKEYQFLHCGSLKDRLNAFTRQAEKTEENLEKNPFSDTYMRPGHNKQMDRYGRPTKGSKTEARGIKAGNRVFKEILEVCEVIDDCGIERPDGLKIIDFGHMFRLYTRISDKVVGMLLRARKHGLVHFEGEMLYQRQDEDKIITLLMPFEEIKASLVESNDPQHCVAFKRSTSENAEPTPPPSSDASPDENNAVVKKPGTENVSEDEKSDMVAEDTSDDSGNDSREFKLSDSEQSSESPNLNQNSVDDKGSLGLVDDKKSNTDLSGKNLCQLDLDENIPPCEDQPEDFDTDFKRGVKANEANSPKSENSESTEQKANEVAKTEVKLPEPNLSTDSLQTRFASKPEMDKTAPAGKKKANKTTKKRSIKKKQKPKHDQPITMEPQVEVDSLDDKQSTKESSENSENQTDRDESRCGSIPIDVEIFVTLTDQPDESISPIGEQCPESIQRTDSGFCDDSSMNSRSSEDELEKPSNNLDLEEITAAVEKDVEICT